jgi:PTS system sucrose-specific IIC component
MTGMHHSFIAIETQLLADSAHTGGSFIFSTASMNNVAQGAAVLAVLLMTKNDKMKSICSASGISALLGITEPAMFGVTLKLKYPFYAAMAGSAAGSAYLAATKTLAQALGAAGLPGFISMKPDHYMNFAIGIILSMGVSFALTMVFWKKFALDQQDGSEKKTGSKTKGRETEGKEAEGREAVQTAAAGRETITELYVPMKGQVLDVEQSADAVFASKALGNGVAINPAEGMVCAPCDGTVSLLFPTKHAVGITSETGVEVLIHIGINTVQLDGQGFEAFVSQGDKVKKGDKLIAADLDLIREKGMNPQTMMILPEGGNLDVTVYPGEQADAGDVAVKAVKTE